MKFCYVTLGCKVNQYETHAMISILISRGHIRAEAGQGCDVCIINTCAVTAESVRKSRQSVRRMKKLEPDALIAICGCFSQLEPDIAASLGADMVGGSGNRKGFTDELERMAESRKNASPVIAVDRLDEKIFEELLPGLTGGRTRANLKIQDGCDCFCSYCVVPYARGRSRSLPLERAVEQARYFAGAGYREIVITGIEISSYGKDLADRPSLIDVLKAVRSAAPKTRLRLGSLDPGSVNKEFRHGLSSISNLCDHFHLSLQSGCDDTLGRMGRKYRTDDVSEAILELRRLFPDCGVTADLIAGFPGETDTEFKKTMEYIKSAAFSDMHVFPFSPRPGTPASLMPDQIEKSVRRRRARTAANLAEEMFCDFRIGQIGKIVEVLFEQKRRDLWVGHSGNYMEIAAKGGAVNSIYPVRITAVEDKRVFGEIQEF